MTISITGLIFTQGFWLYKDYKYYGSQPLLSSDFSYFVPSNTTSFKAIPSVASTMPAYDDIHTDSIKAYSVTQGIALVLPGKGLKVPGIMSMGVPAMPAMIYKELPYKAPVSYVINKMKLQFGISIFIVAFTVSCLVYMLITIFKQRKLSVIKNEFINNMTHELKTPLATVAVAIEAMRTFGALDDKDKTQLYLNISKNELDHLSRLIEMILQQSIFESDRMELNKELTDVRELQERVIKKFLLSNAPAAIALNFEAGDAMAWLDPLHISNALSNLIDNAVKYTAASKKIVINSCIRNDKLTMTIQDNGIGIPKIYHQDIFKRFFRVPNAASKTIKGFGLGLSYVQQVIDLHNGVIYLNSDENGTKFTIIIPIRQA